MTRVAIIGAGAAGLCCARNLARYPDRFQVQVFEHSQEVGGTWVYSAESGHEPLDVRDTAQGDFEGKPAVHSSMYKNLRTNFPKEVMAFPDLPFPSDLPSYPHHSHVLAYLNTYATHYNLYQFIQFGTVVELVEPLQSETENHGNEQVEGYLQWKVTYRNVCSGEKSTETYDLVFVCSGHFSKPYIPNIGLDAFPGKVTHSHVYREPESYSGQDVLVVGGSYSGRDLMLDLAKHARTVYFCNRGNPVTCPIPGNVEQLPAISGVCQDGVAVFVDGRERKVDSIILATGYLYSYPFLTKDSGVCVSEGKRVFPLYKHTINAVHPSLAFIGVPSGVLPFPFFDLQVRWVISVWIGDKSLPSKEEMIKDIEETYQQRLQEGLPPHRASHWVLSHVWAYYRELARLGGSESTLLYPATEMIYGECYRESVEDVMSFRSTNFSILGEKEWFCSRPNSE